MKNSANYREALILDLEPNLSENCGTEEEIIVLPADLQNFSDDQRRSFIIENWGKKINQSED